MHRRTLRARVAPTLAWAIAVLAIVGIGMGLLAESYAPVVGVDADGGSVLLAAWWVVDVVGFSLAFGLIPLLLLYLPEGRPDGRAAAWLARITVVLLALTMLSWIVRDQATVSGGEPFPNPLAPPVIGTLAETAVAPLVTTLVGCAVVAIGIAVLRYRLYEIDRVVSRTVTYAVVTAALITVYAAVATLPSAVSALESDLLTDLGGVVAATVQPTHVSLWICTGDDQPDVLVDRGADR